MIVATAISSGEIVSRRLEYISRGSLRWFGPVAKSATTTSSKEAAKAKSAPDAKDGAIEGTVTRRNAVHGRAPHDAAARIISNGKAEEQAGQCDHACDFQGAPQDGQIEAVLLRRPNDGAGRCSLQIDCGQQVVVRHRVSGALDHREECGRGQNRIDRVEEVKIEVRARAGAAYHTRGFRERRPYARLLVIQPLAASAMLPEFAASIMSPRKRGKGGLGHRLVLLPYSIHWRADNGRLLAKKLREITLDICRERR